MKEKGAMAEAESGHHFCRRLEHIDNSQEGQIEKTEIRAENV